MADDRHERIRQRAHAIWVRDGKKHGDDERHWHEAAAEIDAEDAAAVAAPARKPAPRKAAAAKPAKPEAAPKPKAARRPKA